MYNIWQLAHSPSYTNFKLPYLAVFKLGKSELLNTEISIDTKLADSIIFAGYWDAQKPMEQPKLDYKMSFVCRYPPPLFPLYVCQCTINVCIRPPLRNERLRGGGTRKTWFLRFLLKPAHIRRLLGHNSRQWAEHEMDTINREDILTWTLKLANMCTCDLCKKIYYIIFKNTKCSVWKCNSHYQIDKLHTYNSLVFQFNKSFISHIFRWLLAHRILQQWINSSQTALRC